ncbi:MAG: recombinase family protein [Eubacterium sp.]
MDIYAVRERIKKENINFMNLPLRVTFYARVSTEFNVQLNSLDNQITYYTDFIKSNPNWEYVDGYVDEGISGVSTAKRERFNEMIEDGKLGLFDLVITKEVSRFARNTLDSIRFTRELLSNGVAVYFQSDNINTLDEDSELRLTIMSSMAQDESRKISNRVRFGHHQAIKNGTVLGTNNMFGYTKKDGKLMIDEEQAGFIRELFEMYATGKFSMKQMEKHFYQKGIRNSKGNKLSHSTMGNIIRNPKYKGYFVGNKVVITDLFTKKQKFLPEEEWVMYKDETGETVPAIVSEELWERANEVLYMRSQDVITAQHKTVHQNLLTGKLICAHCGKPYYRKDAIGKNGEKMSKWVCSGKIKNGADSCPSHAIYENEIKPIIEDIFKSGQQNIEELSACVLKLVSELLDSNDNKNELVALNKELTTQQKMKTKLLKFNTEGNMSDSEFLRMTAECDEEIAKLQTQIDAIADTAKTEQDMKKELANIKSILKAAEKHIDGEEIDKAFVDRYIKEIIVYPEEDVTRFEIRLNAGTQVEKFLENARGRTGHISKKMIKAYEESMK